MTGIVFTFRLMPYLCREAFNKSNSLGMD